MSSAGSGTKDDCSDEVRQQFTRPTVRGGGAREGQQQTTALLRASQRKINLSSRRGGSPISKHVSSPGTNKNIVPIRPETMNGCAGEG
jgi:hypothetical protein